MTSTNSRRSGDPIRSACPSEAAGRGSSEDRSSIPEEGWLVVSLLVVLSIGYVPSRSFAWSLVPTAAAGLLLAWFTLHGDGDRLRLGWLADLWIRLKLLKWASYVLATYLLVEALVRLEFLPWPPLVWVLDHSVEILSTIVVGLAALGGLAAAWAYRQGKAEALGQVLSNAGFLLVFLVLLPEAFRPDVTLLSRGLTSGGLVLAVGLARGMDARAARSLVAGALAVAIFAQSLTLAVGGAYLAEEDAPETAVLDTTRQTATRLPALMEASRADFQDWMEPTGERNCFDVRTCRALLEEAASLRDANESLQAWTAATEYRNSSRKIGNEIADLRREMRIVRDHTYSLLGYLYEGGSSAVGEMEIVSRILSRAPSTLAVTNHAVLAGSPACLEEADERVRDVNRLFERLSETQQATDENLVGRALALPYRNPMTAHLRETIRSAFDEQLPQLLSLRENVSQGSVERLSGEEPGWRATFTLPSDYTLDYAVGTAYVGNESHALNVTVDENASGETTHYRVNATLEAPDVGRPDRGWLLLEVRRGRAEHPVPVPLNLTLPEVDCGEDVLGSRAGGHSSLPAR